MKIEDKTNVVFIVYNLKNTILCATRGKLFSPAFSGAHERIGFWIAKGVVKGGKLSTSPQRPEWPHWLITWENKELRDGSS